MPGRVVRYFNAVSAIVLGCCAMPMDAQSVATVTPLEAETVKIGNVTIDATNAPLVDVLKRIARQAGLNPTYAAEVAKSPVRVTIHVANATVADAFERALRGTDLAATFVVGGVTIARKEGVIATPSVEGSIAGKVIDAKTKLPLNGVAVQIDASKGAVTGDDGSFRVSLVSTGSHTLVARLLGYAKATRVVMVGDGQVVSVDIVLEPSVNALDQVVVTGTVIPTELKAVPNAITVITAKQIEERGITKIDQLFRGDVPGLFALNQGSGALLDEVTMFSRGATSLTSNDPQTGALIGYTSPIKTYVDGVEMADPRYLSQIDPRSIERIEILTGPQASTIYGSNAINGVMQIFTKRGTASRPQFTLNLLSGFVQSNFSSARTPQHDYSAQLNGIEGRLSYNTGGSWQYIGPWTPAKQTARTGGFGGARLDLPTHIGRVSADISLRRSTTQNRQRGSTDQTITAYREIGWLAGSIPIGLSEPTNLSLSSQTMGLTLNYAPTNWWTHQLEVGQDASDAEQRYTAPGYTSVSDTTLFQ